MLDTEAPTFLQPSMTTAAVIIPQSSEIQTESSSPSANRGSEQMLPKKRKWSRSCFFTPSLKLQCGDRSAGAGSSFPRRSSNVANLSQDTADTPGISWEGIACDVPSRAVEWLDLDFWTMEGLLAFVKDVASADRDLVDDTCGELAPERAEKNGSDTDRWSSAKECSEGGNTSGSMWTMSA